MIYGNHAIAAYLHYLSLIEHVALEATPATSVILLRFCSTKSAYVTQFHPLDDAVVVNDWYVGIMCHSGVVHSQVTGRYRDAWPSDP